jgi:carbamoyltransferase
LGNDVIILGIHAYTHDSAAALIADGRLVAAAEEERFVGRKHTSRFPEQAIRYCLSEAGIALSEVDHVAIPWNPWINLGTRSLFMLRNFPKCLLGLRAEPSKEILGSIALWGAIRAIPSILRKLFGGQKAKFQCHFVTHHDAHAASAFFVSPFDTAAILTIDGAGEWDVATLGIGEGNRIRIFKRDPFPHSLGMFYGAITQYLGFQEKEGEGKVMALASFGEPILRDKFKEFIRCNGAGEISLNQNYFRFQYDTKRQWYSQKMIDYLGPARKPEDEITEKYKNVAATAQVILEDTGVALTQKVCEITNQSQLCLAGGVVLNSVMNSRILNDSNCVEDIFIQPAANDAGGALGAALWVHHQLGGQRIPPMEHTFWGPDYTINQVRDTLNQHGLQYIEPAEPLELVAHLIADGAIVGWFQRRAEWGPRALGNRSILADPRRRDMKDILNSKVKFRESFRPFAPAILSERVGEYFVNNHQSPFMLLVEKIRPEKIDEIPAVVHVDGTGRLQTVTRESNPKFYALIKAFDRLTGVPMVLNTSFNVKGKPIVLTPEDAIDCFCSTGIDILYAEGLVAWKEPYWGQKIMAINESSIS